MKILYAIQGTGNGHISRARDIIPELNKYGEVDILISGIQADVKLPFDIKYKLHGLSFIFGENGGVDFIKTVKTSNIFKFIRDIFSIPITKYDIVISDFEPVTCWAGRLRRKDIIGLSHQSAVLHPNAIIPKPKNIFEFIGKWILRNYAPIKKYYGFYFSPIAEHIYPAIIREEIRTAKREEKNHYTIYLPAYSDKDMIKILNHFPNISWHIFSKHTDKEYQVDNIKIFKPSNHLFIESLATGAGVLMGAGFEGPCEALFLGKKLMVIPMKNQYEQICNAVGLESLGVHSIPFLHEDYLQKINDWINAENKIEVHFPTDTAEKVVKHLISDFVAPSSKKKNVSE